MFVEDLAKCVSMAAKKMVMLSIETMDDPFINSLTKIAHYKTQIKSPWLQAYPDLGNLSAWPENDVPAQFEDDIDTVAAVHLKDTRAVTPTFKGQFKNVPFGEGCVDFEGLLRMLVRLQYNGSYTIEMWTGDNQDADPVSEIKDAKAYFDALFNKVGIQQEEVIK